MYHAPDANFKIVIVIVNALNYHAPDVNFKVKSTIVINSVDYKDTSNSFYECQTYINKRRS